MEMSEEDIGGSMVEIGPTVELSLNSVIATTETTQYGVIMGSGKAVQGKRMCTRVVIGLPELTVVEDFLPLELENLDMVLGMQWLQKQGSMTVDWRNLAMTFAVGDVKVVLKGDPSLTRMEISLKMLMKQWQPNDRGYLVDFRSMGISKADSKDVESHLEHLTIVFTLLREYSLFANWKKCHFGRERIEYLGHWVSSNRVEADREKIRAMLEWPIPRNIKELRGFLGLTGYYHRFVANYGTLAAPLTRLAKKNSFHWTEEATSAFEQLKSAMVTRVGFT
ncbi:uncharacterized protein LOC107990885 [Cucumis melo]|uniref:Uncharacterized protein LOC107990885 n=1 Tax=Cucumis melo TaxID=3656 RepID=A0A1S4DXF1_CUCME|nr:uncharacterized protein LOC107990885 [Cucumis melo]